MTRERDKPLEHNGHRLAWEVLWEVLEATQEIEQHMVYGTRGPIGYSRGSVGFPPRIEVRCLICRHRWRQDLCWYQLMEVLDRDLAVQAMSWDPKSCEDYRNLRLIREVMET